MALITELDDRTLVDAHHAGDDDAFRQIVVRHHRALYANALRRLGDPVMAEDAVQEALLRAFRALDRFDGDYHLDAWLHRILTNVCADMGRSRGRDTRLFDKVSGEIDLSSPPADDSLETLPVRQLETALDSLPENYREVLLLRFVDEMSYRDVALKAGISEENARARVSRGRLMLRRMLDSASAVLIWAIPPLRRNQLTGTEADVAGQVATHSTVTPAVVSQGITVPAQALSSASGLATNVAAAAPAVSNGAAVAAQVPVLSHASAFVAQAAPSLVQAAPALSGSASAMGKAAVAVGIAASVAIPAGVAVEHRQRTPAQVTAAPATDAEPVDAVDAPVEIPAPTTTVVVASTTTPTSAAGGDVVGQSGGGAVDADLGGDEAPTTTPTTAGTSESGSGVDTDGSDTPPAGDDGGEPVMEPGPPGLLDASSLHVQDAGPRLQLTGPFHLSVDRVVTTGSLTGKVLVGDADTTDPAAPRPVEGDLTLQAADGTALQVRLKGTATVTTKDGVTTYDLDATLRLAGGEPYGLSDSGRLVGELRTRDGAGGELHLTLPGVPREKQTDSGGSVTSGSTSNAQSSGSTTTTTAPAGPNDGSDTRPRTEGNQPSS